MISVKNLTKEFGPMVAVNDLSFDVEEGQVLGFLGPNGAGKSTTMKMITGFLAPTSGSATICGFDIGRDTLKAQEQIGYLPEGAPCYEDMWPREFLSFIGQVRGLQGIDLKRRVDEVIEQLGLHSVLYQSIDTLSKGYKRRVGLAQAILHDPKVLILDEPTDGLDPNQKQQVRELIQNIAKDKIVIISTHILEEVSAVCSRAVIIAQGRIVADGTPLELEARSRFHHAVTVQFSQSDSVSNDPMLDRRKLETVLRGLDDVLDLEVDEESSLVTVFPQSGQSIFSSVYDAVSANQWSIESIHVEKGRLDEVFRQITTEA